MRRNFVRNRFLPVSTTYFHIPNLRVMSHNHCPRIASMPPHRQSKRYKQMQEPSDLRTGIKPQNIVIASCWSSKVCNVIRMLKFQKISGVFEQISQPYRWTEQASTCNGMRLSSHILEARKDTPTHFGCSTTNKQYHILKANEMNAVITIIEIREPIREPMLIC